jgi:predicted Zn-dependent peptidase
MGTKNYAAEKPLLKELDALMEQKEKTLETNKKIEEVKKKLATYRVEEDVMEIYRRQGATNMNGATAMDTTCYYAALPSNRIDLWLMLEADRFSQPVFRDFYRERDVVLEERRLTETCSPNGQFFTTLTALSYQVHPNRNPIIGWGSDIANITRREALDYFKKYYVPNNATIVLVGDITVEKAKEHVSKYFGVIPRGPKPPEVREVEPPQQGERRASLSLEMRPTMAISYHTAALSDRDSIVLDLLTNLLADGRTSRLYKKIVTDSRMANDVSMSTSAGRYPGLTFFVATPEEGRTYAEIEKSFYEELERVKTEPVKSEELETLKNRMLLGYLRSLESNNAIAEQLAYCSSVYRWQYLLEKPDIIRSVTSEDIMRVAKKYFTKENRTILTVDPKTATPPQNPSK